MRVPTAISCIYSAPRCASVGAEAIVIVASGVGLTSGPYNGAYAANEAFQIVLGETLWYELNGTGVDVLVAIGGLMNTQGDGFVKFPRLLISEPEPVAREVLSAVGSKHMVVPGLVNRAFVLAQTRLLSRRRTVSSIGSQRPRRRLAHRFRTGVGPLAVVGFGVLAVALLAATLGHDVPPYGQGVCRARTCGRIHYILSRTGGSPAHPGLWFDRSR